MRTVPAAASVPASSAHRPLDTLEHLFWLLDRRHPMHFALGARITGPTSVPAWRAALATVQARHPLLSVRIHAGEDGRPHFRPASEPIALRVVDGGTVEWERELATELAAPFASTSAPLLRAVLLHAANETTLLLTAHHSIADGLSLAFILRDVLRTLSGTADAGIALPVLRSGDGGDEHQAARALPDGSRPARYRTIDGRLPHVECRRFTPAFTTLLTERARRAGTTVNGALCAAVAIAGSTLAPEWRAARSA